MDSGPLGTAVEMGVFQCHEYQQYAQCQWVSTMAMEVGLFQCYRLLLNNHVAESESSTNPLGRIRNFCPSNCKLWKTGKKRPGGNSVKLVHLLGVCIVRVGRCCCWPWRLVAAGRQGKTGPKNTKEWASHLSLTQRQMWLLIWQILKSFWWAKWCKELNKTVGWTPAKTGDRAEAHKG